MQFRQIDVPGTKEIIRVFASCNETDKWCNFVFYMIILPIKYFQQENTLLLAKDLIGKILVTHFGQGLTSGRIVETEAYLGENDRASHAFGNRRTARTEAMYLEGGHSYIYLCYGIHHLFNIVTHRKDVPHAILIRGLEPMEGIDLMMQRRKKAKFEPSLSRGPGSLAQAMGLHTSQSGKPLDPSGSVYLTSDDHTFQPDRIDCGPRIGVAYAAQDALLPYRFFVKGHPNVSRPNF
ncbi:MAG: DNA-3-methyladenine glycosylase [Chitinophagaceae bacterium]|nr:DNA-3-methyladenine glycosylase [Chitinophagaceae bacterium]